MGLVETFKKKTEFEEALVRMRDRYAALDKRWTELESERENVLKELEELEEERNRIRIELVAFNTTFEGMLARADSSLGIAPGPKSPEPPEPPEPPEESEQVRINSGTIKHGVLCALQKAAKPIHRQVVYNMFADVKSVTLSASLSNLHGRGYISVDRDMCTFISELGMKTAPTVPREANISKVQNAMGSRTWPNGKFTTLQISTITGLSKTTVNNAMRVLMQRRVVTRPNRSWWEVA